MRGVEEGGRLLARVGLGPAVEEGVPDVPDGDARRQLAGRRFDPYSQALNAARQLHAEEVAIVDLILAMLPIAAKGLTKLKVADEEIQRLLKIIETRLDQRMTGARWQKLTLAHYENSLSKDKACQALVKDYLYWHRSGQPIVNWERKW